MNIKNIKELIEVLKVTETYDQTKWFIFPDDDDCFAHPGCIGGHAFMLMLQNGIVYFNEERERYLDSDDNPIDSVGDIVDKYLGITRDQSEDLFFGYPFLENTNEYEVTAKDAIATLKNLIDTGIVEWVRVSEEVK